ncbi:tryptophan-rich sensory protein [Aquimarina sp. ERC-38]|uniref:tryptophan-rich sensory protein n=1 Tax=Aquimarina sp. ERC-38 TaxID=2949996 RepID=UPI0022485FB2|nr:tryptophan-rich sensory protein [Aquimarina sp. ERC-38]UZO80721.1 tryptophan-rich sensory protein [Aquimarina sp. ERC-38]
MQQPTNYINKFKNQWKTQILIVIGMYGFSGAICTFLILGNVSIAVATFFILIGLFYLIKKPQKITTARTIRFIDRNLQEIAYSSGLFIKEYSELSRLEKIQYHTIQNAVAFELPKLKPPVPFKIPMIVAVVSGVIGLIVNNYLHTDTIENKDTPPVKEFINFTSADSLLNIAKPKITDQFVILQYPSYTGIPKDTLTTFDLKVVEGTVAIWNLEFDQLPDSLSFQSNTRNKNLDAIHNAYVYQQELRISDFYNFTFLKDTTWFSSDLHAIQIIPDEKPSIEIQNLDKFNTLGQDDDKNLRFTAVLEDDFGLNTAYIIATVSNGSGESVKFREEKLNFDTTPRKGSKYQKLTKNINLDFLKMVPGDELYFYVEVSDQKTPAPNISRSETYFAKIRDTVTDIFAVEGAMAVDLMPAYFRSQRQLIIDTEKLIKERPKILKSEFNRRSNNLGYEQKALRIKYGQFMGDESELEVEGGQVQETHEHEDENLVDQYTHKHDTENEHNLVEEKHDHEHEHDNTENEGEATQEDPLESYLHNHDDPEESTLFTASLKSKLRIALSQMWDAELQLRLYQPKKSLPYQYRALRMLQEIKNSARIYVHRIGFDPEPIKEETRLTGDLKNIKTGKEKRNHTDEKLYPYIQKAIQKISESPIDKEFVVVKDEYLLFKNAGKELAQIAIDQPGRYLQALQILKKLTDGKKITTPEVEVLKKALFEAIPNQSKQIEPDSFIITPLDHNYLKTLQVNG